MTGQTVHELMRAAKDDLAGIVRGRIELDPDMILGDGFTRYEATEPLAFYIGVKGLETGSSELSDYEAMLPIVALFHEVCGHGGQILREFDKRTDLSRILAMNYFACKGSCEYYDGCAAPYEFTSQYKSQPYEIAAQYSGLRSAMTFLSRAIGAERADAMLTAYVNERSRIGYEFVDGKYRNMDDVKKAFEKAFAKAAGRHHKYRSATPDRYDSFHACISGSGLQQSAMTSKVVDVMNRWSGLTQDFAAASMYLHMNDRNMRLFERPVFEGIDFSLDNALSRFPKWPKPKVKNASLDQLTDMAEQVGGSNTGQDGSSGVSNMDPVGPPVGSDMDRQDDSDVAVPRHVGAFSRMLASQKNSNDKKPDLQQQKFQDGLSM